MREGSCELRLIGWGFTTGALVGFDQGDLGKCERGAASSGCSDRDSVRERYWQGCLLCRDGG